MKSIVLALILGSTLCLINAEQSTTPDYRDKYDELWLEWVNERIKEGERYLERLVHEVTEFKKTHNEELRKRIETQVDVALTDIKASLTRFETELKNPNLDILEKYTLEKADAEGKVVIKVLTEVLTLVKKA